MSNTIDQAPTHGSDHDDGVAAAAPRVARPRVAPRRSTRGAASHEREANRTADQILRGATGAARGLSRTASAAPRQSISVGRRLDPVLRKELETAFGIDFDAVRIHADAAADAVVHTEGARAFTAGSHLWFRSGEFAPHTTQGRRLLLHELAHAVQQSARAASGGRLAVTDAAGAGPIQADDFDTILEALVPSERFGKIFEIHGLAATRFGNRVTAELAASVDPSSPEFTRFAEAAAGGAHGANGPAELSLVFDLLKAGQAFAPAVALLLDDTTNTIRTVGWSLRIIQELRTRRIEQTHALARSDDELRGIGQRIGDYALAFLRNPDHDDSTEADLDGLLENRLSTPQPWNPGLSANERDGLVVRSLRRANNIRIAAQTAATSDGGQFEEFAERGLARAQGFTATETEAGLSHIAPETAGSRLLADLHRRGRRAIAFWSTAGETIVSQRLGREAVSTSELAPGTRTDLRLTARRQPLRRAVDTVIDAGLGFLRAGELGITDVIDYRARSLAFEGVVRAQSNLVNPELTYHRGRALPAVYLLSRLNRLANQAHESPTTASRFTDAHLAHRAHIALEIRRLGVEYGRVRTEAPTLAVLQSAAVGRARLEDAQTPHAHEVLLLVSDWTADSDAPLSQFEREFGNGVTLNDIEVPVRMVVDFYRSRIMTRLVSEVDRLVSEDDAGGGFILEQAITASLSLRSPTRWVVEDYDWLPHDGDERTLDDIIREHPKTVQKFTNADLPVLEADDTLIFTGAGTSADREKTPQINGVFLWQVPDYVGLLAEMVYQLSLVPRFALSVEGVSPDDPVQWLAALQRWIESGGGAHAERRRLMAATQLETESAARLDGAQRRLGTLGDTGGFLRIATNHDRAIHREQVKAMLDAYRRGDIRQFEQPRRALTQIRNFSRYALPADDSIAQLAALLIELAGYLHTTFNRSTMFGLVTIDEDDYDLVTGYWGLIALAMAWAETPENRDRLRSTGDDDSGVAILDRDNQWFDDQLARLQHVRDGFERTRQQVSRSQGFAVADDHSGFRSLNYASVVPFDGPFGIEGERTWEVEEVRTPFRYQPRYGTEDNTGIDGVESSLQGPSVFGTDGALLSADAVLFSVRINGGQPEWITAGNLTELEQIWRAVEARAFQLSMQNLNAAITESLGLVLDIAELIPGAGQVLMVGRILASITMFLSSADFEDIKSALQGEVIEQINRLKGELGEALSPERLWDYLLFGNLQALARLNGHRSTRNSPGTRRRGGALGALLTTARSLGPFIARRAEQLSVKMQRPLRNTQSFVQSHPPVLTAVGWAANFAHRAVDMDDQVAEIRDQLESVEGRLAARVTSMADAVAEFELPEEIIPNDQVAEAILGLILDRFGAKGRIVRRVLESTTLLAEAGQLVAEVLEGSEIDPNVRWREEIYEPMGKVLGDARNDLIRSLHEQFDAIGFGDLLPASETTIDLAGDQPDANAHEAQPTGERLDLTGDIPSVGSKLTGQGASIPLDIRSDVERRFGQDFSDVRLHAGTHADAVTRPIAADGVTSGSHVFLRPNLSLRSARGAHVLRHELTHVLQQTGDRSGPRQPTLGPRAGTGPSHVVWNPTAEAEAEAVATSTGGSTSGADVAVGSASRTGGGLQPSINPAMASRILHRLASYEDLRAYHRTITDRVDRSVENLNPTQQQLVNDMKDQLREAFRRPEIQRLEPDVRLVPDLRAKIGTYASDRAATILAADAPFVNRIAQQSLVRVRQTGQEIRAGQRPTYRFQQRRFLNLFESYLLVRAGLNVEFDKGAARTTANDGRMRRIEGVEIKGLFMGAVTRRSSRTGLWDKLLNEQFPIGSEHHGRERPANATGAGAVRRHLTIKDAAHQSRVYLILVKRLRDVGPRANTFDIGEFELHKGNIVEPVVDTMTALGDEAQVEEAVRMLPTAREFTHPADINAVRGGKIGLLVRTHGDLIDPTTPGRESHHTTQFLLSEFFSNEKGVRPLEPDDSSVDFRDRKPIKVWNRDRRNSIDISELRGAGNRRGNPMPAILIAAVTHRRGRLHVSASGPDEGNVGDSTGYRSAGATQTNTVERWWNQAEPRVASDSREAAADRLYGAVRATYGEMKKRMLPALETALTEHEKPFYEALARLKHPTLAPDADLPSAYQITTSMLGDVHRAAEAKNHEVMAGYGFED